MSTTATKIPLAQARDIAARLVRLWGIQEHTIAGSIRREEELVGDIDLCIPAPAPWGQVPPTGCAVDPLYERLAATLILPEFEDKLFGTAGRFGRAIRGVKPEFKAASMIVSLNGGPEIKVEIERYSWGRYTNRGWKLLMRTGPAEFSKAVLQGWKAHHRRGPGIDGSKDGFLLDDTGRPFNTPDEMSVFDRIRTLYVHPQDRIGPDSLLSTSEWVQRAFGGRPRIAMGALGVRNYTHLDELVTNQREATRAARAAARPTPLQETA